jgi:hypothetical protein
VPFVDLVATIDKPFPGGFRLVEHGGANFYPLPGSLARPAARIWPGGAWAFFGRFEKAAAYDGSYLRWPIDQTLESTFYLGSGDRARRCGSTSKLASTPNRMRRVRIRSRNTDVANVSA